MDISLALPEFGGVPGRGYCTSVQQNRHCLLLCFSTGHTTRSARSLKCHPSVTFRSFSDKVEWRKETCVIIYAHVPFAGGKGYCSAITGLLHQWQVSRTAWWTKLCQLRILSPCFCQISACVGAPTHFEAMPTLMLSWKSRPQYPLRKTCSFSSRIYRRQ